jgi:hypothetical protein
MGRKFLLLTDNSSVKHVFIQHDLNGRQVRQLAFLSEFDFEVRHIKGKENKVVDTLSQRNSEIYEVIINKEENSIEDKIKYGSINDEEYIKTIEQFQRNEENMHNTYLIIGKSGLLRFKYRLYVPKSTELKMISLDDVHTNPYSGHLGYQKMIIAL